MPEVTKQMVSEAAHRLEEAVGKITGEEFAGLSDDLKIVVRYQGELRREKSGLKEKLDAAEKSLATLQAKLLLAEQELTKARQELRQANDHLASTNSALIKSRNSGELSFEGAQARLERLLWLLPKGQHDSEEEIAARQKRMRRIVYQQYMSPEDRAMHRTPGHTMLITAHTISQYHHADAYTILGMCIMYAMLRGISVLVASPSGVCAGCIHKALEELAEAGQVVHEEVLNSDDWDFEDEWDDEDE